MSATATSDMSSADRRAAIGTGHCSTRVRWLVVLPPLIAMLAGCASRTAREPTVGTPSPTPSTTARPGAYYKDDGPGFNPPANLEFVPDATPRLEPLHRFANRPYTVLGRDYTPATELRPFRERGIASWYGRKFHGERTSTGEPYDMYAMTAAHPTLPLPSYARVTNVVNGKSVIVRVNDRGPFLHGRIIDLSYTAALKLGYVSQGSAIVDVETLIPENGLMAAVTPAVIRQTPIGVALPSPSATPPAPVMAAPAKVEKASAAPSVREHELSLVPDAGNVFVQLGAFATLDQAENFLSVVEFQLAGTGYSRDEISHTPRIRSRDNLFRVEIGPYATRVEAQRAAADLESRFGVVPSTSGR